MTRLYVAAGGDLMILAEEAGRCQQRAVPGARGVTCLALDPGRPEVMYCGTMGEGLWSSDGEGSSWERAWDGVEQGSVSAVAVSPLERGDGPGVVYAGTEPSALYRSEDGGRTWVRLEEMERLPSAPTWSFPPRPHTSHVRWITPDPLRAGWVYVCIEAGALVRTRDGGLTWEDRQPDGPRDTHTLAAHPLAPGRLYSAAGDGYFESRDRGDTWLRPMDGLRHGYVWGLAVAPDDPDTVLVSAARSAGHAHNARMADSHVYRRIGDSPFEEVVEGLPEPRGTTRHVLAADPARAGTFYAACNRGVYRSTDAGSSWERLDVEWPGRYVEDTVSAFVVTA